MMLEQIIIHFSVQGNTLPWFINNKSKRANSFPEVCVWRGWGTTLTRTISSDNSKTLETRNPGLTIVPEKIWRPDDLQCNVRHFPWFWFIKWLFLQPFSTLIFFLISYTACYRIKHVPTISLGFWNNEKGAIPTLSKEWDYPPNPVLTCLHPWPNEKRHSQQKM